MPRIKEIMSVLKRNRGESQLEFLNSSHQLELYTIRAAHRETVIPRRYRLTLGSKLTESARKINQYIAYANSLRNDKPAELKVRLKYQRCAIIEIQNLIELVTLTSELFPSIKDGTIEEWTRLMISTENSVKRWKESDEKRFKRSCTV